MAKKRAKVFETKYFGFVIAAFIVLLITILDIGTNIFEQLNTKTVDLHFVLKNIITSTSVQEGVTITARNPKISEDLIIIGIDSKSLAKFGKWPFPRSIHANLIDSFSRIKDQSDREASLFVDVFIIEPDPKASDDARLVRSIDESGRVYMETVLDTTISDYDSYETMLARQMALIESSGSINNISGPWREMREFLGVQAPLIPYGEAIKGYGHANYTQDFDEIYRKQALIAKFAIEIEKIPIDNLIPGFNVDVSKFERLAWIDSEGLIRNISTPISEASLVKLKKEMEKAAPQVIIDQDGDGIPEQSYFIVRKYKDYFIPSITLTLAMDYFGVDNDDVEIVLGKHIKLQGITKFDSSTGQRLPYEITMEFDKYNEDGDLIKPGKHKILSDLIIPINENGEMLINYMGYRSSSSIDGYQTFPVRSYSSYASQVPGLNPDSWPRTKAVGGKILMVGPFADGIAQDEKPTPFGLMFGIEIHTNSLNTILMNNFLRPVSMWIDLALLVLLVFIVALLSSRFSTLLSFFSVLFGSAIYFLVVTFIFEYSSLIVDFSKVSLGMAFTFIAIISYRAMTEERDKRQIRETFGKYVSPKVVDQILEHPPELGGVDKDLTVLFSDIRGFTTLSENMTPQELVNHLNVYLTSMTDLILEYGGTLDKYVGDEVMCFWGAPLPQADHAILSCKCALRQMEKLHELNMGWPESKRINIGIGLNSGIMTVGNMGSPGRMNYTLMGDNVNLGARLEGTNKQYGTNIIISEFTFGMVKDHFIVRELDNIRVKGKNKPVLIYELVDCVDSLDPPKLENKKHK